MKRRASVINVVSKHSPWKKYNTSLMFKQPLLKKSISVNWCLHYVHTISHWILVWAERKLSSNNIHYPTNSGVLLLSLTLLHLLFHSFQRNLFVGNKPICTSIIYVNGKEHLNDSTFYNDLNKTLTSLTLKRWFRSKSTAIAQKAIFARVSIAMNCYLVLLTGLFFFNLAYDDVFF